jgi:Lrp/AsnC family transcriptional regulator of ectoine degradation
MSNKGPTSPRGKSRKMLRQVTQAKLDSHDIKILALLQRDGRMTKLKLAEKVFLSPSACLARVRRLEKEGYIQSYRALIGLERLISTCSVLVSITLKSHRAADFKKFETCIRAIDEIVECYETGGGVDYILRITALDIGHYQEIVDTLLDRQIGIEKYSTHIVTKPVKAATEAPILQLLNVAEERLVKSQAKPRDRADDLHPQD